jgi:hypothetical protein
MAESKFVELVTAAHQYLSQRQAVLARDFGLSRYERWDWDADRGSIIFSSEGTPRVIATAQLVGSFSKKTGTWHWAWANRNIDQHLRRDLAELRTFGEQHGIWQLTTPKWEAEESDAWEMTSISAHVLQAKGAYRMPGGHLFTFAILESVAWVPGVAA